jgi:hypothetical protein
LASPARPIRCAPGLSRPPLKGTGLSYHSSALHSGDSPGPRGCTRIQPQQQSALASRAYQPRAPNRPAPPRPAPPRQTEGATLSDGRSASVWDVYVKNRPDQIRDGSTAAVATDFYHRYKDDIALMKSLGVKSYRMSISWSRLIPSGRKGGAVNPKGLEFYNNVINELLKAGISPAVTLYHWDMPQANQDAYKVRGGGGSRRGPWRWGRGRLRTRLHGGSALGWAAGGDGNALSQWQAVLILQAPLPPLECRSAVLSAAQPPPSPGPARAPRTLCTPGPDQPPGG